ncbi:MAG: Protein-N(5)-glutamine methyltransferase PrmC, methylates polypeptide chain release factor [Polaromonas sp.]|jgi:methylase of polypeptide subunit release factors|nr:Protein-N(5)-glutamine methyltransferase PrmC, methylates polypeptide chain release factor [Polaromonas sp.]MDB5844885.1 Protein-N(5)-glutamine methyltransferase PrmC, methylates polypeptide chain release factor [Polaromonas sp.]
MVFSLPDALVLLGRWLHETGYRFTAITPASHARVNARHGASVGRSLRDVFGWSRPFEPGLLPGDALGWLRSSGLVEESGGLLRSRVRFASLGSALYAHSAYPTLEPEAVFFGPDTYRFAALIESELQARPLSPGARILDIGCGAGPGGMTAALACPAARPALLLADINPRALAFARANAALAGLANAAFQQSDLFESLEGRFELIVANPPYLVDDGERTYRHGGGPLGSGLSLRIVRESLKRLAPGGRLVLYTGAPIVGGRDPFLDEVATVLERAGCPFSYREIDPDVFGEELDAPAYADTERIAAVALVATPAGRPAP